MRVYTYTAFHDTRHDLDTAVSLYAIILPRMFISKVRRIIRGHHEKLGRHLQTIVQAGKDVNEICTNFSPISESLLSKRPLPGTPDVRSVGRRACRSVAQSVRLIYN